MSAPPVSYGASEVPPRPVTPAGTIPDHTPAKALDELVGEPSALEKAMEMGKTYVGQVQAATKPYTDAAAAKAKEVIDKIEGVEQPSTATSTEAETVEAKAKRELDSLSDSAAASSTTPTSAKGIVEQIQDTFQQITHTIDEKTASATHPGLVTQVTNVVQQGVAKVDAFLDKSVGDADVAASVPGAAPVTTTTNTVPHAGLL